MSDILQLFRKHHLGKTGKIGAYHENINYRRKLATLQRSNENITVFNCNLVCAGNRDNNDFNVVRYIRLKSKVKRGIKSDYKHWRLLDIDQFYADLQKNGFAFVAPD